MEIALPFYVFSPCHDILPYDSTRMTHERKRQMDDKDMEKKESGIFLSCLLIRLQKKKDYYFSFCASSSITQEYVLYFPTNVKMKDFF